MAAQFAFDHPDDALRQLAEQLLVTDQEQQIEDPAGRVLAEPILADRESPAADVSAMDGYAIHLDLLRSDEPIPVRGESCPGSPPPTLAHGTAVRIFTGALIPPGCEAVVKREDTIEHGSSIQWQPAAKNTSAGAHIRRGGENTRRGETALSPGRRLGAAEQAVLTNFGHTRTELYSKVNVGLLTTGDEVLEPRCTPEAWQLRNSNRTAIQSIVQSVGWVELTHVAHASDDQATLRGAIERALAESDAVIMTGGVSMGDYDFVPEIVRDIGADIVFHKLPIRPGKPILGAATTDGKLILGLPGNPVSATIGCQRFALPLLAKMSGQESWLPPCPTVQLKDAGEKTLPLHWLRPVRLTAHGVAELVPSKGSGDLVALAKSSGFIEMPPHASGPGPWPYHAWR